MDREHEEQMINNFRAEMEDKIKEKEREQQAEKMEREKEKKDEEVVEEETATEEVEAATEGVAETAQTEPVPPKDDSIKVEVHATAVHHELLEPRVAHAQAHEISHSQAVSAKPVEPS
jgi:hypothetical protein